MGHLVELKEEGSTYNNSENNLGTGETTSHCTGETISHRTGDYHSLYRRLPLTQLFLHNISTAGMAHVIHNLHLQVRWFS